jgi:hypothetical protein
LVAYRGIVGCRRWQKPDLLLLVGLEGRVPAVALLAHVLDLLPQHPDQSSTVASRGIAVASPVAAIGKGGKTRCSSATSIVQPVSFLVALIRPALMLRRIVDLLTPVAIAAVARL